MPEGMRPITVDSRRFRWRFDERIVVIPAERSGPQLYVDWGWIDWQEPQGPGLEPLIVTPRFVAEAIRFALANGWRPEESAPPMRLSYDARGFHVTSS